MFIQFSRIQKADTPDANTAERASQQEQAEYAANPFDHNTIGVSLPGSTADENFMIGNEYNEIQGIASNRPAFSDPSGMPGADFDDFGIESANVGINPGDAMRGLDSDGTPFFNDRKEYDARGFDSMAGIVPVPLVHPSPLIAGDGQAQATDAGWNDAFDNASYGPVDSTDE